MPTVSRPIPSTRGRRPGRDEQVVPAQFGPVAEREHALLALLPRGGGVNADVDLDPLAAQGLGERLAERRGLTGEHVVGALDERHLAAQPAHDLGELEPRRPAAQHDQPPGDLGHRGRVPRAPEAGQLAQARDGRDGGIGAAGDHDVLGRVARAVNLHNTRAGQAAATADQCDAAIREPFRRAGVGVVGDHEVAPRECRRDVHLGARPDVARRLHGLARPQQGLRGDACPVRALAPDQLALDDGDVQASFGERRRAMLARRTSAEHDDVVVHAHSGSSSPACSLTM